MELCRVRHSPIWPEVDMEMSGPRTGACIGASFHNDNNDITIADSSELLGSEAVKTAGMLSVWSKVSIDAIYSGWVVLNTFYFYPCLGK